MFQISAHAGLPVVIMGHGAELKTGAQLLWISACSVQGIVFTVAVNFVAGWSENTEMGEKVH